MYQYCKIEKNRKKYIFSVICYFTYVIVVMPFITLSFDEITQCLYGYKKKKKQNNSIKYFGFLTIKELSKAIQYNTSKYILFNSRTFGKLTATNKH